MKEQDFIHHGQTQLGVGSVLTRPANSTATFPNRVTEDAPSRLFHLSRAVLARLTFFRALLFRTFTIDDEWTMNAAN